MHAAIVRAWQAHVWQPGAGLVRHDVGPAHGRTAGGLVNAIGRAAAAEGLLQLLRLPQLRLRLRAVRWRSPTALLQDRLRPLLLRCLLLHRLLLHRLLLRCLLLRCPLLRLLRLAAAPRGRRRGRHATHWR